ncbi:primase-helicase family protein [Methylobacter sp.]|uniref:primase-helicase family protein n=1 Tax=Methylobacter sp. TaxID=2051955 RepID=UPI0025D4FB2A|nr:primase-helicase family protein [Methylobacter sp.]
MAERMSVSSYRHNVGENYIDDYIRAVESAGNALSSYDYLANIDRFRHRGSGNLLKERALVHLLGRTIPKNMPIAEALYTEALGIRQYASVTFAPGQSADVITQGQLELNTWVPSAITAIEGDATMFLDLVDLIFDHDSEAVAFFLDAIAALVQKPGVKWAFMILIIGPQGIGKSLLCEMVAELVGHSNVAFPTHEVLKSPFTGWLMNAYVVIFHELDRMGREVATRLKHWITSETLLINSKNVPEFHIRNYANILACSNHDDIATIEEDDRRMFSWLSKAEKQPPDYYTRLYNWFFQEEGKSVVLDFLLRRDISRFNPNAAPPRTACRSRLIENGRSECDNFLLDALERHAPPFASDLCTATEILQYLRVQQIRCSDAEIRRFLRQYGVSIGQTRIRGDRPCLWAVRDHQRWASAQQEELANEFAPVFEQTMILQDQNTTQTERSAPMPIRLSNRENN